MDDLPQSAWRRPTKRRSLRIAARLRGRLYGVPSPAGQAVIYIVGLIGMGVVGTVFHPLYGERTLTGTRTESVLSMRTTRRLGVPRSQFPLCASSSEWWK